MTGLVFTSGCNGTILSLAIGTDHEAIANDQQPGVRITVTPVGSLRRHTDIVQVPSYIFGLSDKSPERHRYARINCDTHRMLERLQFPGWTTYYVLQDVSCGVVFSRELHTEKVGRRLNLLTKALYGCNIPHFNLIPCSVREDMIVELVGATHMCSLRNLQGLSVFVCLDKLHGQQERISTRVVSPNISHFPKKCAR